MKSLLCLVSLFLFASCVENDTTTNKRYSVVCFTERGDTAFVHSEVTGITRQRTGSLVVPGAQKWTFKKIDGTVTTIIGNGTCVVSTYYIGDAPVETGRPKIL